MLALLSTLILLAGSIGLGLPTAGAATVPAVLLTLATPNADPLRGLRSGEWDPSNSSVTVGRARADELNVTVQGGTAGQYASLRIRLDTGQRFAPGRVVPSRTGITADLWRGENSACGLNWYDIRDLAYAGSEITRIDIAFQTYCSDQVLGDLQLVPRPNGPSAGVRTMIWPDTPIGTHAPVVLPVWIRNFGTSPSTVGTAQLAGAQAGEFALTSDRCSGRALRPGAGCTLEVRFGPRTPGAKAATLRVPVGSATLQVDLAGSAPTGRSTWQVHRPQLRDGTPAADYLFTDADSPTWAAGGPDSVELEFTIGAWDWSLWLRTKSFTGLKLGTQTFGYDPNQPDQPELNIWGNDLSCAAGSGTMNIKQLEFGPNREVKRFSISIRRTCIEDQTPVTAEISYRASDPSPVPSGPYVLRTGQSIGTGGTLRSSDGVSFDQRLKLGTNGQAVITSKYGQVVWGASPYKGFGRSYRLGVLADGSVAISDAQGRAVWRQAPIGIRPGDFLVLHSNGNLVLYTPDYHPLWSALPI